MQDGADYRVLILSNGHGEDAIGAELVRRLPAGITAEAYPTIGSGAAYQGVCPIVGPRAVLPSEGSRVHRGSLRADLRGGAIGRLVAGLRFLRTLRNRHDDIVVVGDSLGIIALWLAGHREVLFLDVYKTGFGRPYGWLEQRLVLRTARHVFSRSPELAAVLNRAGGAASCHGNVMLDTVPRGNFDASAHRSSPHAVTLLPGSRGDAPENFALFAAALRLLPAAQRPDVFLALAGTLDPETLASATGLTFAAGGTGDGLGSLEDEDLLIHLVRGRALGNLLEASDAALALSGTAAIQAMGSGVPVIGFRGATERHSRFEAESALFGPGRIAVAPTPEALAGSLSHLLSDPEDRARRAAIGRERVGGTGTLEAVLGVLEHRRRQRSARASASA
ncbi:hypothetical protein EMQ25_10010 [Arsenicitalea aurantiaca]|uniref:Glycosyltransferase n=1 Tax=Arsenicitalea aurantiaca TaxID=1783274 RepID=A0A433XAT0_9HYPH|nr:hypothetical protein EMQ25_10010 [Arsenicitalea aurantiaca]